MKAGPPGIVGLGFSLVIAILSASCSEAPVPRGSQVEAWFLGEPSVVIGARYQGPAAFSPVESVAMGPRAEVHVLLPQDHQVRVFGGGGEFIGSIGAEGAGPGEFSRPSKIGFVGDTLWVLDDGARRVSYFLEGEFVGVQPFPPLGGLHPERSARVAGVITGPKLIVVTDIRDFYEPVETTTPGLLLAYADGIFDTLALVNVDHVGGWLVGRHPNALPDVVRFTQPFNTATQWALSPKGDELLVVDVSNLATRPASFSAIRIGPGGDTLSTAIYPYDPVPIPEGVIDSVLAGIDAHGFSDAEVRESTFLPPSYPPVSGVLIFGEGEAWIAREAVPGQDRKWQVTSTEAAFLAEVMVPEGFKPRGVGGSAMWGLVLDELEVPYLTKRPIHRH